VGDFVTLSVADSGPGIDSFEQGLIFDKFYRGRDQRYLVRGTGMGLPIAKAIATAHGGTISVTSQLGTAPFFRSRCPLLSGAARSDDFSSILVIDDEPQIRRVLRSTLSFRGYEISEASTGEEGVELARKLKPDLILLDVNLPGISGIEACREIRHSSDAPIIMLTVRNSERDKVVALDAGADDYVTKPFSIEELLARVRASLRRHAPADALPAFQSKDLSVDFESRRVTAGGEEVHLARRSLRR